MLLRIVKNERDFMMSLANDKHADNIDAFNTTTRYLDDILNITNVYFDNMVSKIYPSEIQLNKANTSVGYESHDRAAPGGAARSWLSYPT